MTDQRVFRSIPMAIATFALLVMLFSDKERSQALISRGVCRFLRKEPGWSHMKCLSISVDVTFFLMGSTGLGFQRTCKYQDFCQLQGTPLFSVLTALFEVPVCERPWDFSCWLGISQAALFNLSLKLSSLLLLAGNQTGPQGFVLLPNQSRFNSLQWT